MHSEKIEQKQSWQFPHVIEVRIHTFHRGGLIVSENALMSLPQLS